MADRLHTYSNSRSGAFCTLSRALNWAALVLLLNSCTSAGSAHTAPPEPDLISQKLLWIRKAEGGLTVTWHVKNGGIADIADTFRISLYLDGHEIGRWRKIGLRTGHFTRASKHVVPLKAGRHLFLLKADVEKQISESDEQNNVRRLALLVDDAAARAAPDAASVAPTLSLVEQAYLENRHEQTIGHATALLQRAPAANDARFLRGMAYWRTGNTGRAIDDIAAYMEVGGVFEKEAMELLDLMRRETGVVIPVRFGFMLGVMYDDHVINREALPADPERASGDTGLRAGWNIELGRRSPWSLRYRGRTAHYFQVAEASRLGQSLDLVGAWSAADRRRGLTWNAGGESLLFNYEPDLWRARTGLTFSQRFNAAHAAWIGFDAGYDDRPEESDDNGAQLMAGLGSRCLFENTSLYWSAYGAHHRADAEALSYTEYGGNLGVTCAFADHIRSGVVLYVAHSLFDDLVLADGETYSADYTSIRFWASFGEKGGWQIVPFAEYSENDATVDDDDFDRAVFGIDVIYGIL